MAAEIIVVGGQDHLELALFTGGHEETLIGIDGVEVEGEEGGAFLVHQGLAGVVQDQLLVTAGEDTVLFRHFHHGNLEVAQVLVLEVGVVGQTPLAAAVVVTPAVALPGEIDPLGVAEFVAHEGQVALAAQAHGQQPQQLVQCHAPVHDAVLVPGFHGVVHFLVAEAEHDGLIAHQGLVVAFAIADDPLVAAAGGQFVVDLVQIPIFVAVFLQQTDPHIRLAHGQTVIEAQAAPGNGQAQAGQGRGILGNGDGVGIHLADQLVGQLQIGHRFGVGVHGEIALRAGEGLSQTVVVVQHGGHTVEAEAVEVVFLHPELQIAQQEMDDLVLVVVKAFGAPGTVVAPGTFVEELVGGAVKFVDALPGVDAGVGMDHIQQHGDPHAVGGIDEGFQFLRGAEPGGGGIEVGDLVAEGGVVGVLHNGHDLQRVVAQGFDTGKDPVLKLGVGAHLGLFLGHADVAFVDQQVLLGHKAGILPYMGHFGVVDHGIPFPGDGILHHTLGVQGNAVQLPALVDHNGHDLLAVLQRIGAGKEQLKQTVFAPGHGVGMAVPAAKITGEVHGFGSGGPLPVDPAALGFVEAVKNMAVGKVR